MTLPVTPRQASWCDACMGSRRCWVCDGAGSVERRYETADCPSCRTSGQCRYCTAAQAPESIALDPPAESAAAGAAEGGAQG